MAVSKRRLKIEERLHYKSKDKHPSVNNEVRSKLNRHSPKSDEDWRSGLIIGRRQPAKDDSIVDRGKCGEKIRGGSLQKIYPPDPPDPPNSRMHSEPAGRYGSAQERVMADKEQTTGLNTSTEITALKRETEKTMRTFPAIPMDLEYLKQEQLIHWEPPGLHKPEQEAAYIE